MSRWWCTLVSAVVFKQRSQPQGHGTHGALFRLLPMALRARMRRLAAAYERVNSSHPIAVRGSVGIGPSTEHYRMHVCG